VAADASHVYVVGYAAAGVDHIDAPREPTTDGFLRVYSPDGVLEGEIIFDGSLSADDQRVDYARGVTVDDDFVYVVGGTDGQMGLDPSLGDRDIFLAKIPKAAVIGNVHWNGDGC
jgi:hypothetical protein